MRIIIRVVWGLVQVALAFFIFLNLHEMLHTAAARVLGDPSAHYVLLEIYNDGYAIGRNYSNPARLTPLALILVSLAGPVGTRLLSQLVPLIRRRWNRPAVFWAALFIALRLDLIGYVVRNFVGDVLNHQPFAGQDIAQPIHLIAGEQEALRLVLWGLVITLSLADGLLDQRRIRRAGADASEESSTGQAATGFRRGFRKPPEKAVGDESDPGRGYSLTR